MLIHNDGMVSAHKKTVWFSFIIFEQMILMDLSKTMNRLFTVLVAFLLAEASYSQRVFLHVQGGMMNYGGDMQDQVFAFNQANSSFGLGIGYKLSPHFTLSANYTKGKLAASDAKTNKGNYKRNLSFYSNISEMSVLFQANLNNVPDVNKFTPYIFGGIGYFHFDPYAFTPQGDKVYLQPLHTEGQGLAQYPERKPYNLNQFAIPFGFGLSYALNEKIMVGAEIGFRQLFTDYLDDLSSFRYADTAILRSVYGEVSAKMSFRSDETDNPFTFSTDKLQRANPDRKDTYYTAVLKVTFLLGEIFNGAGSNSSFSKSVRKQAGCPTKVL